MTTLTPDQLQCTQPPLCICTTTDSLPTAISTMGEGKSGRNASGSGGGMAGLTVGLGILSAVLAILLVGAVLGWV